MAIWEWFSKNLESIATLLGAGGVVAIIAQYFLGKKNKIGNVSTKQDNSPIDIKQANADNTIKSIKTEGKDSGINIIQE